MISESQKRRGGTVRGEGSVAKYWDNVWCERKREDDANLAPPPVKRQRKESEQVQLKNTFIK